MKLDQAINVEDLHRMAKRKLPKIIFDYIEGGVEDERGLARNEPPFIGIGYCRATWSTFPSVTSPPLCSAIPIRARSASRRPAASVSTGGKAR